MTNQQEMKDQIKRLQDNLLSIRKIAGWTSEELGDRIGVTKQTISNIENSKVTLSQTQYIAIRAVLDFEMKENPENTVLPKVITLLLDSYDEEIIKEAKEEEVKVAIETIAATAAGGIAGAQLALVAKALLVPILGAASGPLGVVSGAVAGASLGWLSPFFRKKSKKSRKCE